MHDCLLSAFKHTDTEEVKAEEHEESNEHNCEQIAHEVKEKAKEQEGQN